MVLNLFVYVFLSFQATNGFSDLVPAQILAQFRDYYTIFHYDNETKHESNLFHCESPFYLVNYNDKEEKIISRSHTLPFLNIVYLSDFARIADVGFKLLANDVVVFFFFAPPSKSILDVIFKVNELYRVGGLFVYVFRSKILYNCCFYCGNQSGLLNIIHEGENIPDLTGYVDTFRNFHHHKFQIAYADYLPFFNCIKFSNGECDPQGSEGQLLKTMSKYLNFRYELIVLNITDTNLKWFNLRSALQKRSVQFAVGGISLSLTRSRQIDFTRFIHYENYKVLFTKHFDRWPTITRIVRLFQWPIYVLGAGSIVIIALFGKFSTSLTQSSNKSTFIGYVSVAFSALIEQSSSKWLDTHSRNYSLKAVFLLWWLLSLCLGTLFKSQLASFLIKPTLYVPTRIEELVDGDYTFQANPDSWPVLKENFEETTIAVYKEVLKRMDDRFSVCDAVLHGLKGGVAIVDEETPLRHNFFTNCSRNMSLKEIGEFLLLEENLFPGGYHAWGMPLSVPFRKIFSRTIGRLFDAGLISHWNTFDQDRRHKSHKFKDSFNKLSITRMLGPFTVLFIGLIVAFAIFLIELIKFL